MLQFHTECLTDSQPNGSIALRTIIKGSNCIYVLNEVNLEIVQTIDFGMRNYICPRSLFFYHIENIITTAYKLTGHNQNFIKNQLFAIFLNQIGDVIKSFELRNIRGYEDCILVQDKLITCQFSEST